MGLQVSLAQSLEAGGEMLRTPLLNVLDSTCLQCHLDDIGSRSHH